MFKNYYTTAMSAEKKLIERRFTNISKKRRTGRIRSMFAAAVTITIMAAAFFTSGALADSLGIFKPDEITVIYDGAAAHLENKPFIDNNEVYVPLRETLNICGVTDNNITYQDGKITMVLHSDVTDSDYTAHINIGRQNIKFDGEQSIMAAYTDGERTTTHPAVLRDGVTYVPLGMLIRIKQYDVEITDESEEIKDFRYSRALPVKLLKGLQIRKDNENGGFDVLLTDWTVAESTDPADYYENGENVFIGTAEEQETLGYDHNETNYYHFPLNPVKRILVDDEGRVIAVVPIENQRHEAINGGLANTTSGIFGWSSVNNGIGIADTENPSNWTWYLCATVICDPETAYVGMRSLGCYYIPAELFTPIASAE